MFSSPSPDLEKDCGLREINLEVFEVCVTVRHLYTAEVFPMSIGNSGLLAVTLELLAVVKLCLL